MIDMKDQKKRVINLGTLYLLKDQITFYDKLFQKIMKFQYIIIHVLFR